MTTAPEGPDPTTAGSRWVSATETARLIRPILRQEFPGVKFSVRSDNYAGGCAVRITWTDGPTYDQVTELTAGFDGTRFDSMTDCRYGADSWYCAEHGARPAATYGSDRGQNGPVESRCCAAAELVHFAPTISTERRVSPEFEAELGARVAKSYGLDRYDPNACPDPHSLENMRYMAMRLGRDTPR